MKTGRNDTCPCGSGKKFKRCCQAPVPLVARTNLLEAEKAPAIATAPTATSVTPLDPGSISRHLNAGLQHHQAGRLAQAEPLYRKVLAAHPQHMEALHLLGVLLHHKGDNPAALTQIGAAIALAPTVAEYRNSLGLALQASQRDEEAESSFRYAISLNADFAEAHANLGALLKRMGKLPEAEASLRHAIRAQPAFPVALNSLGLLLHETGRDTEAIALLRTVVSLSPNWALAHSNLGSFLRTQGRIREALASLRRALELDASLVHTHSMLLLPSLYSDAESPADIWKEHEKFAGRLESSVRAAAQAHTNSKDPERPLRVGYVSADFRAHSVAHFIEPVLERHDRQKIVAHCYYSGRITDHVTERLRSIVPHWLDCGELSDEELADRIRSDRVDILVDLSGHTSGNRLSVFARKPAPVQLSWIGYPYPTGLRAVDFHLTDALSSPDSITSEREYRLPGIFSCYRPSATAIALEPVIPPSTEIVTFGSFNNAAKISDTTVQLWSSVVCADTSYRLYLKDRSFDDPDVKAWQLSRFLECGVSKEAIRMEGASASEADHLGQYGLVDIALDTFPYCGVTTTCEALWMGVPVISLCGDSMASRMGLTLLSAAGKPQWAARDRGEFLDAAKRLAVDASQRVTLRKTLRQTLQASPLMDEKSMTLRLEDAYRDLWRKWCQTPVR